MLLCREKGDCETRLNFVLDSADQGYELAYGDIGSIAYLL